MRVKAIGDLAQRADREFFREIAAGLERVAQNASTIDDDARQLWQTRSRGYAIPKAVAVEEAAKFLILLDVVRCPRCPPDVLGRQLARFRNHLSKGLYAQSCYWEPATFAEMEQWITRERADLYLDGPNDVDFIYANQILNGRESTFYVDFIETDEGHEWTQPRQYDVMLEAGFPYHTAPVITLVRDFHALGFADARALEVVAKMWRSVKMRPEFHRRELRDLNRQTSVALENAGLLRGAPDRCLRNVIDRWLFPLYSLDLSPIRVDRDHLRAVRDNYREMGV